MLASRRFAVFVPNNAGRFHNALKHSGVKFFELKLHGSLRRFVSPFGIRGWALNRNCKRHSRTGTHKHAGTSSTGEGHDSITSKPQSGTEINVHVPLQAGAQREESKLAGA